MPYRSREAIVLHRPKWYRVWWRWTRLNAWRQYSGARAWVSKHPVMTGCLLSLIIAGQITAASILVLAWCAFVVGRSIHRAYKRSEIEYDLQTAEIVARTLALARHPTQPSYRSHTETLRTLMKFRKSSRSSALSEDMWKTETTRIEEQVVEVEEGNVVLNDVDVDGYHDARDPAVAIKHKVKL
jgi:hypothetical protein